MRRSRYNIYKRIIASYNGYRDGEDGVLEKVEGPAEANLREEEADEEWRRKGTKEVVTVGAAVAREVLFEEEKKEGICCSCEKEIERMIVKKMMELLSNMLVNSCWKKKNRVKLRICLIFTQILSHIVHICEGNMDE
ncbi:Isy1-like splicing [Corchorus olitorius]|uniref:Isy1-like splicing n=1 Tax=Corchorus olitorius TaxID=93759 RepID=A0A1R3KYL7_9ROSI|nr:Isy1-like splicing [Corchorus olitorius]